MYSFALFHFILFKHILLKESELFRYLNARVCKRSNERKYKSYFEEKFTDFTNTLKIDFTSFTTFFPV